MFAVLPNLSCSLPWSQSNMEVHWLSQCFASARAVVGNTDCISVFLFFLNFLISLRTLLLLFYSHVWKFWLMSVIFVSGFVPSRTFCLQAEEAEGVLGLRCPGCSGILSRPPRYCRWTTHTQPHCLLAVPQLLSWQLITIRIEHFHSSKLFMSWHASLIRSWYIPDMLPPIMSVTESSAVPPSLQNKTGTHHRN